MSNLPKNPSASFKRLNPALYGPDLGGMGGQVRECDSTAALVRHQPRQPDRKGSVAVVISLIAFRHRVCDSDNSGMGGCKALRDAIAQTLGCDDGSERLRWQYAQCHTSGAEGTLVKIERL